MSYAHTRFSSPILNKRNAICSSQQSITPLLLVPIANCSLIVQPSVILRLQPGMRRRKQLYGRFPAASFHRTSKTRTALDSQACSGAAATIGSKVGCPGKRQTSPRPVFWAWGQGGYGDPTAATIGRQRPASAQFAVVATANSYPATSAGEAPANLPVSCDSVRSMTHVPDLEHHRKEAAEARAAKLLVKRPDLFAKAGSELPLKCPGPDVSAVSSRSRDRVYG